MMAVKRVIPYSCGTFFITFTCYKWMPLIDKVNDYDIVYKWFDYLKAQGHFINAVVPIAIGMPNHVHAVISFIEMQSKESVRRTTKNMKYGNCLLIGSIVAVINLYNRKWITFIATHVKGNGIYVHHLSIISTVLSNII